MDVLSLWGLSSDPEFSSHLQVSDLFIFIYTLKFVYSEKATKFCEISLSTVHTDKSKVEISQNFVAFSEYMNFTSYYLFFCLITQGPL